MGKSFTHKNQKKVDLDTLKSEVEITFYKSSGPGGQRKNRRETAVRIYHPKSGTTTIATEHRSQAKNRELALKRLEQKLIALSKHKKPRIPTKLPKAVKERRLKEKKIQSEKKRLRFKIKEEN